MHKKKCKQKYKFKNKITCKRAIITFMSWFLSPCPIVFAISWINSYVMESSNASSFIVLSDSLWNNLKLVWVHWNGDIEVDPLKSHRDRICSISFWSFIVGCPHLLLAACVTTESEFSSFSHTLCALCLNATGMLSIVTRRLRYKLPEPWMTTFIEVKYSSPSLRLQHKMASILLSKRCFKLFSLPVYPVLIFHLNKLDQLCP